VLIEERPRAAHGVPGALQVVDELEGVVGLGQVDEGEGQGRRPQRPPPEKAITHSFSGSRR
jgi:hypothetical protein